MEKWLIILVVGVICISPFAVRKLFYQKAKSTVVILNGPSACGKSSIQEAFIRQMQTPWLKIGIDNFFVGTLSNYYIFGEYKPQDLANMIMQGISSTDQFGNPLFTLKIGPAGEKIIDGMNHAIKAYADSGNNVIVDYIAYEPQWLENLFKLLKDHHVIVIGVNLPLEALEQREAARATSPKGHARSHFNTVHKHLVKYNLEIDTDKISPEDAGILIKNYLKNQ